MEISASIRIDRRIDDVFSFVSRVENMARWVSGVSAARLLSPVVDKGARFEVDYTSTWRKNAVEFEISEYEPPHLMGLVAARGPFAFRGRLKLAESDGTTEVTNEIEADPDSLSTRLVTVALGPLLSNKLRERLRRELLALDQAITGSASLA